ncbi:cytochrome P450 [Streptosporangium sp. CA-115845]|uniref:cytochrome P450 n=1 Tax=Streptosporangium sp. CA-115845 TaxID=3240071 RepID=UPI003D93105C
MPTTALPPLDYNPFDFALHEDPYPTYARLREEAPVYLSTVPEVPFYALSRHGDVWDAFRDPARFSSSHGVSLELWSPEARKRSSFISMDPPEHTQFRSLVSRGFSPRRVAALEPRIRELTRARLAEALDAKTFDFTTLVQRIPVDVISELIDVPKEDRDQILTWSNLIVQRDEEHNFTMPPAAMQATRALVGYYAALIAERRRHLGDDMVSALIAAEIDGNCLTDADICAVLLLLGVAGNESTIKLLGNAWYQVAIHPDQRAVAFAPGGIRPWVEETIRYDSSGQMVARLVTTDTILHEQVIPAGSRVLLLAAAANRDPRVFPNPDQFDLGRDTSRLLSFGSGPHFCLGAALARMETTVVLEELVAAVHENYEVGIPVRVHSPNMRGFSSLPTTVTPR